MLFVNLGSPIWWRLHHRLAVLDIGNLHPVCSFQGFLRDGPAVLCHTHSLCLVDAEITVVVLGKKVKTNSKTGRIQRQRGKLVQCKVWTLGTESDAKFIVLTLKSGFVETAPPVMSDPNLRLQLT